MFLSVLLCAVCASVGSSSPLPPAPAPFLAAAPIWSPANLSTQFALLRSPEFKLRGDVDAATLYFAAEGSPRPPAGTTQAKLLGAAMIYVNGVLIGGGPGHNVPTASQVVRGSDIKPYLRPNGEANVVAVASYFASPLAPKGVLPRLQAALVVTDAKGNYTVDEVTTSTAWTTWAADKLYVPTGNAGISWYPFPNEDQNRSAYPVGWSQPGWNNPGGLFVPAAVQPDWPYTLYYEPGPAPVALIRTACKVITPTGQSLNAVGVPWRQIIDYGQEFMGGVNLSFPTASPGWKVTLTLAEELLPGDTGVLSPMRTGNNWNSTWTLAGEASKDTGIVHHEFIQFRYAQVDNSPIILTEENALAWVVQHPAGGDGRNPWEAACSTSTPASEAFGGLSPPPPSPSTTLGNFTSSNPALNSVWQFCAYTIIATSLDVNVDGQTRQRDPCVVDALNTALGQFYVFSYDDVSVQTRTFLEMMTNDTVIWPACFDFKASTVLTAAAQALYASNGVNLASTLWSDNDDSILSDSDASYNSLQFLAGLRYWNGSGRGLLSFPANGSCLGSWSCNGLVDWPPSTRDGYDVSAANSDDTARNALGIMAYNALGDIALWLGHNEASVRYKAMAATASEALLSLNLRHNGSEAYFVDGAVGSSADHAAVHSTLYSISAGVADAGGEPLAKALTAYLARHGVAPSSCMMGRWWVDGLYNLGVYSADAADLALTVLTTDEYPSWRNMMAQGATTTMEAWRPADKANLDWAHPWCASPSFTIPSALLGVKPASPAWGSWRVWPQPSSVGAVDAVVPTPAGLLSFHWESSSSLASLSFNVLPGQTSAVCMPPPQGTTGASSLIINGAVVPSTPKGRLLCSTDPLAPGQYTTTRAAA